MVCSLSGNGLLYGCYQKYPETAETTRYVAIVKKGGRHIAQT